MDFRTSYHEASEVHEEWLEKSKEDWEFYNGKQWADNDIAKLRQQKRPALTLNYLRSLVRVLVGYENRTRYNMKVFPVGEYGDDEKAKILTRLYHNVENKSDLQYVASSVFRSGLIGGRGWFKVYIDHSFNVLGDLVIVEEDPANIMIDPYCRRLDLLDAKYLFVDHYYEKQDLEKIYPDIDVSKFATEGQKSSRFYKVIECWYRDYSFEKILINKLTKDIVRQSDLTPEMFDEYSKSELYAVFRRKVPKVRYAVLNSAFEVLEEDDHFIPSQYFPYVLYTPEFIPAYDDDKPDWVGIIRDLKDCQREINKKRSYWTDLLSRLVNPGYIVEKGAVPDIRALKKLQAEPGVVVEVNRFEKIKEKTSQAPHPALLTTSTQYIQDMQYISLINPAMLGFSVGTRESGRSMLIKQQSGSVTITPYQDNMQLARCIVAKLCLKALPLIYTAPRIARALSPDGTVLTMTEDEILAVKSILLDSELDRYDIEVSDVPVTPTQRIAEFVELREVIEMLMSMGVRPSIGLVSQLVNASDISKKKEVIQLLNEAAQGRPA